MATTEASSSWATVASFGIATAVLGYCVYFDHKRRSAPDFKEKLIAKRKAQKEQAFKAEQAKQQRGRAAPPAGAGPQGTVSLEELKGVLMQELQVGQMLAKQGDKQNAAQHLANAVLLTSQVNGGDPTAPQQLIQLLQMQMPEDVFMTMMMYLQKVQQQQQP